MCAIKTDYTHTPCLPICGIALSVCFAIDCILVFFFAKLSYDLFLFTVIESTGNCVKLCCCGCNRISHCCWHLLGSCSFVATELWLVVFIALRDNALPFLFCSWCCGCVETCTFGFLFFSWYVTYCTSMILITQDLSKLRDDNKWRHCLLLYAQINVLNMNHI